MGARSLAHVDGPSAVTRRRWGASARYGGRPVTADRDPPSPDTLRTSGPADVPVALLVAARRGDPAAFARVVEHWDAHLRRFVHVVLAGTGSTDRVLSATYVSAYRALPRYRSDRTPGLWLHRLAYLAATDEIRRLTREPLRKRDRSHRTRGADPVDPPVPATGTPAALGTLAPDQRALLVLVDIEGYLPHAVADAFDTDRPVADAHLAGARRVVDPQVLLAEPVPPADDRFWTELGRRLLAE
ncbi:MAG: sigT, partial [Acidimicrobiales bacterium]|nr:sigT [Acidimicrobiales bacterium]